MLHDSGVCLALSLVSECAPSLSAACPSPCPCSAAARLPRSGDASVPRWPLHTSRTMSTEEGAATRGQQVWHEQTRSAARSTGLELLTGAEQPVALGPGTQLSCADFLTPGCVASCSHIR